MVLYFSGEQDMEQIQSIDEKVVMFRTHEDVVSKRGSVREAGRKWWRCNGARARRADYAFVVIDGVVRGVYKIMDARLEERGDDPACLPFDSPRWAFDMCEKAVPNDVRDRYKDKHLPDEYHKWGQNPVRYTF